MEKRGSALTAAIRLDVVIPSYNRAEQQVLTIESLVTAPVPPMMGVLAREHTSASFQSGYFRGPRFPGIARWRFRIAVSSTVTAVTGRLTSARNSPRVFAAELTAREYGGMLYGRHLYGRGQARGREGSPGTMASGN